MDESARDTATAAAILDWFARASGLEGGGPPRRYLWTDAFAVCTCLSLHERTGEARHLERARALVSQVHQMLGRHRPDDARAGSWLSGLPEEEGRQHPTAGGLRIGKPLRERYPGERVDQDLEWERDGQYFHYLTRWMHALGSMARVAGDQTYHAWAAELAQTAHARFTRGPPGACQIAWKMSVDLTTVRVPSTGHHDPLDGLVTAACLQDAPARSPDAPDLGKAIADFEEMCRGRSWATEDPLGIGGLLVDGLRVAALVAAGKRPWQALLHQVMEDAALSLAVFGQQSTLELPLSQRLPFRELGLALGLHATERIQRLDSSGALDGALGLAMMGIAAHHRLARVLEETWLDPAAQRVPTWMDHEDINAVSLAASLAPEGVLGV